VRDSKTLFFVFIVRAENVVLTRLAETRKAMFLARESITKLKVVCAALDALVASDGKPTTTPKQTKGGFLFELF
jgi:hypothetical protein